MIPVVLIHTGKSNRYPLETVIGQAKRFGNEVVLIGDQEIGNYQERAKRFEEYYIHLSGNHVDFEMFCFSRWYILYSWMTRNRVDTVLYTDSDVLLYCNAESEWRNFQDYALTLSLGTSPATSYFTLAGLEAFLSFVDSVYIRQNEFFKEFQRIFAEMQAQGLPGGICDMTLLKFFKENVHHVNVGEMTEVIDSATWDHNINSSDGYWMRGGQKDIEMRGGLPFGSNGDSHAPKRVRFNALHFQGQAKSLIKEYA